jgi:hypothetical protein
MLVLGTFASIGLLCNLWLYFDDIKYRNAVLNKVPEEKQQLLNLMATPAITERRTFEPL